MVKISNVITKMKKALKAISTIAYTDNRMILQLIYTFTSPTSYQNILVRNYIKNNSGVTYFG